VTGETIHRHLFLPSCVSKRSNIIGNQPQFISECKVPYTFSSFASYWYTVRLSHLLHVCN